MRSAILVAMLLALGVAGARSAEPVSAKPAEQAAEKPAEKLDPRYPFRTDFANFNLPWYQPKPGEFPPHHSDRRISGELVSADFIHRSGQFRTSKTGELLDFVMPPYGAVIYLNAEADLRDVPLGTYFLFFLNQDAHGNFTRLAAMVDQFTIDAGHSFTCKLDELKLDEGKLLTTRHSISKNLADLGKQELRVTDQTRVWKGDQQIKLTDLAVGDELLYNLTGKTANSPGCCTEIWSGLDTHTSATEQQRKRFAEFVKKRGLPGWVDKTEGSTLTVTLFSGDAKNFKQNWMSDFAEGKDVNVVVANDELRTWNPGSDKEHGTILQVGKATLDAYGSSGVSLTCKVNYMLEGFRKGRVVRIFGGSWPAKDPYYGESLMGYGYARLQNMEVIEMTPKDYPVQFPFRTDYGNDHLAWFQLKPGEMPPRYAEHLIYGELIKVDAPHRAGQFRVDRSGEVVDFSLIDVGSVKHLGADVSLADLPLGTRCRFHLFQDERGAFTRASLISDEFSYLAENALTWRIEELKLAEGKLNVARQMPEVKNYNGDMEKPHDVGRAQLLVGPATRVWKGDQSLKLADLAVGDALLVNLTGEQPAAPSRCSDIWVGSETHRLVIDNQRKKSAPAVKPRDNSQKR